MPTYATARLGPIRYTRQLGGRHRYQTLWYWLLGVWAFEATYWTLYGLLWAVIGTIHWIKQRKQQR